MTSERNNPMQKTIPFEDVKLMDESKPLGESEGLIAINMVLDLKKDRSRQAMYWRMFAGIVLVIVVVLSIVNYVSRHDQLRVFEGLLQTSPLIVPAPDQSNLSFALLTKVEHTIFFYDKLKGNLERRIKVNAIAGRDQSPELLREIEEFNAMALACSWDPITPPPISP